MYHELIDKIVSKAFHWLYLCDKYEHPGMFHDVLNCIGNIIHEICECKSISEKVKVGIVDRLLSFYCRNEEKSQSKAIRSKIAEKLLTPAMSSKSTDAFYYIIQIAWEKFDKIPYQHAGQDLPNLQQLKEQVIIPLGLNPDAY
ncbi:MAG: hypothetical protein EOP48_27230 [Sphingobacteriales bacterium]|nr:MAG: hypothetical protein EOP48_27230 [Sphingobacteriales bacterium]